MSLSKIFLFFFSVALLVLTSEKSQAADVKFNKKKTIKAATQALAEGNVYEATDLFLEVLKNEPNETSVLFPLAQAYMIERDYENAAKYFNDAYKADSATKPIALYYAALMTKMNGNYREAIPMFQRFNKIYKEDDAPKMKKWSRVDADGCNFALKESQPDPFVKMKHLGKEVNSNYADYSPALNGDLLYYSSVGADTVLWIKPDRSDIKKDDRMMKIYMTKLNGTEYDQAARIDKFAEVGKHFANPSFSYDGTKLFYTRCDGGLIKIDCEIYMSEWLNNEWSEGKPLGEEINLKGCTNTQPYLGKTSVGQEVLFFVSNREGGRGGKDIWFSNYKKGTFSTPRNAGNKVNTDRDELTPFFDGASNTLFFSSDGWISMGGLDIFRTQGEPGKYNNVPENLGAPFNSSCDDYYFKFAKSSQEGYVVSNRPGIFSVRGKTCCEDIFTFKYDKQIYLAVRGKVFDDVTKEPIAGAAVNLSLHSDNLSEGDVVINSDSSKLQVPYFFNLKSGKLYKLSAAKDGYFSSSQSFSTQGISKSDTLEVNIYLKRIEKDKAYRLNNIYYDFDKADLRNDSKATLDTLYNILIENPTIIIELSSHTDTRGSDQYNLNLSQKRAESCVNYLISEKRIPKERITAKGYGETKVLDDCNKYNECPQDQSGDCPCHQLNRRTEFKVTGQLDGKLIYED
jgi:outer membrane protein OmpA-like peptidoglycan-associated protein